MLNPSRFLPPSSLIALLCYFLGLGSICGAQFPFDVEELGEFVVPQVSVFDFKSKHANVYRIYVAKPDGEAPDKGWPVFYVTDGNENFLSMLEIQRKSNRDGLRCVVIGIGYAASKRDYLHSRASDLTPPTSAKWLAENLPQYEVGQVGNADRFCGIIQEELKPWLRKIVLIDDERETLVGHSFGGLFVLRTLVTQSDWFDNYLIVSPSLWWNDGELIDHCTGWVQKQNPSQRSEHPADIHSVRNIGKKKSVFIAVGELEQSPETSETQERKNLLKHRKMVDRAKQFAELCSRHHDLQVDFAVIPQANHGSVVVPGFAQAIRTWTNQKTEALP